MAYSRNSSHRSVDELCQLLGASGIVPCCRQKDHVIGILYTTKLAQARCNYHAASSPRRYQNYNRKSTSELAKEILDRISGAPRAPEILHRLLGVVDKDAFVTFCLYLDAMSVPHSGALYQQVQNPINNLPGLAILMAQLNSMVFMAKRPDIPLPMQPAIKRALPVQNQRFSLQMLPLELREIIYTFIKDEARCVQLYEVRGMIKSACRVPVLLQINRETRNFAQNNVKHGYKLTFGLPAQPASQGNIYFSPSSDTLYFGPRTFAHASSLTSVINHLVVNMPHALALVRHVAFRATDLTDYRIRQICRLLVQLPSLETVSAAYVDRHVSFNTYESSIHPHLTLTERVDALGNTTVSEDWSYPTPPNVLPAYIAVNFQPAPVARRGMPDAHWEGIIRNYMAVLRPVFHAGDAARVVDARAKNAAKRVAGETDFVVEDRVILPVFCVAGVRNIAVV
ncbi:hypothetical protein BJ875DRAFT_437148 [Amylocarpus encephaloides]|uniref:2EXR domain-containing protein n=1 Tax=Amylocarpus encephaloides TaxID=45428 RepID=A0A9P8CB50_9HELO|nr:hypothetical protein BJ875DRAFT_437148 [Amylocarpus encephaloides]